ncbi:MAG TPA: bifunctional oligoribonuclease/PAP phosphatase NrnA [Chloroflexota bacterium]|nr:bifunctional oligoribonuclease/PAP phosphatase NrnA [Chloroflexota bacterium]
MTDGGDLAEAACLLRDAKRIAVLSHVDPDADAVGSSIGLALGLRAQGKDVVVALADRVPAYARFLPGAAGVVDHLPEVPFDVYVFADAADIDRVGTLYTENPDRFAGTPLVDLDHHRTNPGYGTVNVVDGAASSTSELSYRLLRLLDAPIDAETATTLLFGIMGDTGAFQNGATTPGSLEVAADLVRRGADSQRVAFQLFDRKRFGVARAWGEVLETIELFPERRIVYAWMAQHVLQDNGVKMDEMEGITAYLRGIEEADVVMLLKEAENGELRVSLRSRPGIDVSSIAVALGGGGHKQAAGATLPGPPDHAKRLLLETYDRFYGDQRHPAH